MKACVLHAKHDLRYEDVPEPSISDPREVLVRVLTGGICGSDQHYYEEGGIGSTIRVREPIIIGHEGMGVVDRIGPEVASVKVGDRVVMRPSRPCFKCFYCGRGEYTFCENMRHLGSAALFPHTQGLLAEKVLVHEAQLAKVGDIRPEVGAFAEPLSVAYNGARRLGDMFARDVLVMGGGPIGCLCAAAARVLGAGSVTVVDVRREPLEMALKMGVDAVCNSRENPDQIAKWKEHKGRFDMMIDASGNKFAVQDGMAMTRPLGIVSQVGAFGPEQYLDPSILCTKALEWRGVFRFYDEFSAAVTALREGWIDPLPLLSASYPAEKCEEAMRAALSPETCKVQVVVAKG